MMMRATQLNQPHHRCIRSRRTVKSQVTAAAPSTRHVDYMLRVVVADMAGYDAFYKKLIGTVPLKNVTSRFAMERIKQTTALPIGERAAA